MNIFRSQTAAGASEVDTTGLHPPPERALEITFHVLLPLEAWNWSKKSHMCMQFNHPKLGEWHRDAGEFKHIRFVGTIFFVSTFSFNCFNHMQRCWGWTL